MISILKLIRYKNLLMIAFLQLILRFGFLKLQNIPLALNDWQYLLLVFSTLTIAAAGYLINNILDLETDHFNKPADVIVGKSISETMAYNLYVILNVFGVGSGFYLSNVIEKPSFATIFVVIALTLYLYASNLKQSLLIGNFVIAILTALSVVIVGIFDLYPTINDTNQPLLATIFEIILDYAIFAFAINFLREIVKDLEDFEGDFNTGMNTLPIVLEKKRTSQIVFGLSIFPIIMLLYYTNKYYFENQLFYATVYSLTFIIAPQIYFSIRTWNAKTKEDFHHLSNVLKLILFFGILLILVVSLNIKYNA
ncbi:MAG: geranylgeranylglycerol-phosphate geranylgeranyltransferase [Flavobacterium sp.]|nr:geranylgeranylglycerol-phosphate geranylgeranyltransferase [Flavobacterium sp.]